MCGCRKVRWYLREGPFEKILAEWDKDGEFWQILTSLHGAGLLEGSQWPKGTSQDPGQQNEWAAPELLGPDSRSIEGGFLRMTDGALRP